MPECIYTILISVLSNVYIRISNNESRCTRAVMHMIDGLIDSIGGDSCANDVYIDLRVDHR